MENTVRMFKKDDIDAQLEYLENVKMRHHEMLDKGEFIPVVISKFKNVWDYRKKSPIGMNLKVSIEHVD